MQKKKTLAHIKVISKKLIYLCHEFKMNFTLLEEILFIYNSNILPLSTGVTLGKKRKLRIHFGPFFC